MIVWWGGDDEIEKAKWMVNVKTKKSLPEKWVGGIERETAKVGDWGIPEMYIVENERKKFLLGDNVKTIYK